MVSKKDKLDFVSIFFCSRCNLNCIHCGYGFANKTQRDELPVEYFVNALKDAKDLGATSVNVTGGEIFIRKDCFELLDAAYSLGYNINIETNGVLLKSEDIEKLKGYGNRLRVAFSVDGIDKETHEKIRGNHEYNFEITAGRNGTQTGYGYDFRCRESSISQTRHE